MPASQEAGMLESQEAGMLGCTIRIQQAAIAPCAY